MDQLEAKFALNLIVAILGITGMLLNRQGAEGCKGYAEFLHRHGLQGPAGSLKTYRVMCGITSFLFVAVGLRGSITIYRQIHGSAAASAQAPTKPLR